MDGMIRAHRSEGVHDPLKARALYLAPSPTPGEVGNHGAPGGADPRGGFLLVALDLFGLDRRTGLEVRRRIERLTGVPAGNVILAASHTHSGPATIGYFNPREEGYLRRLAPALVRVARRAVAAARPAAAGCASGREATISHYRRLAAPDGRVIMNWETPPEEAVCHPLGEGDPELGVLKIVDARAPERILGLAFNHAGHPNVLSGNNYRISADYPGRAAALLEHEHGCAALFLNGAQGSVDIDGRRDRDWEGRERIGNALAVAVSRTAARAAVHAELRLRGASVCYSVPFRSISDQELRWALDLLRVTGGHLEARPDGIGDDFRALLYRDLRALEGRSEELEQSCLALDDSAFVSFPGELFTEIGAEIKRQSPFRRTYLIGLANGAAGYLPTRRAIAEGGYAVETRRLADHGEQLVLERSLALLHRVHGS